MIGKPIAITVAATIGFVAVMPAGALARDQIRVVGSSTVFPFATTVAETFGKTGAFKTPVVESTGSGGGFKLFCGGVGPRYPDIVDASRQITKGEFDTCARNGVGEIAEITIGLDGIVFAYSKRAKHYDVGAETVYRALARDVVVFGRLVPNPYKTWSQINRSLPSVAIKVFGPPPTSGTRDAFVARVMDVGCRKAGIAAAVADPAAWAAACGALREDGAYVEAGENDNVIVRKLDADVGAVGIFGFGTFDQNHDRLQAAAMDGQAPTAESIADGRYEVARPLFIYVKKAHLAIIPGLREFVMAYVSEQAIGPDGYLIAKGLVALPVAAREAARAQAAALVPVAF